ARADAGEAPAAGPAGGARAPVRLLPHPERRGYSHPSHADVGPAAGFASRGSGGRKRRPGGCSSRLGGIDDRAALAPPVAYAGDDDAVDGARRARGGGIAGGGGGGHAGVEDEAPRRD